MELIEPKFAIDPNTDEWDLSSLFGIGPLSATLLRESSQLSNRSLLKPQSPAFMSRTHCGAYTLEVRASAPCGVDMEFLFEKGEGWNIESATLQSTILAPGELDALDLSQFSRHPDLATVVWTSKEALAKALGDAMEYDPTRLLSPAAWNDQPPVGWHADYLEVQVSSDRKLAIWVVLRTSQP